MAIGKGSAASFPNYGISAKIKSRDLSPLRAGGGGATSRFVCGYMTCDRYLCRPVLNGLPPVFKVNIRADRSGQSLESCIMHLMEDTTSEPKPCLPNSRKRYSSIHCGAMLPVCRNNKWDGLQARAIPSWVKASV